MFFDYMKEVFKIESVKTDFYFFTYKLEDDKFFVVDVYLKPEFRKTKHVKELYDKINMTFILSEKRFCHSMVQRSDPNFKNALSLNLKYGMKIIRENEDGKIYLRKEKCI